MELFEFGKLGDTIKRIRLKKGKTIEWLAGEINCSTSTISRIELYGQIPHEGLINRLMDALGIDDFFQSFIIDSWIGMELERKRLKKTIVAMAKVKKADEIEELLIELKGFMRDEVTEDQQFYLVFLNIFYELSGILNEEYSKRYEEIFYMSDKIAKDSLGNLENIELTRLQQFIIIKIGVAYLNEGHPGKANRLLKGLLKNITKKTIDTEDEVRDEILAVVANNLAISFMQVTWNEKARETINYAEYMALKTKNLKLLFHILKTKEEILKRFHYTNEMENLKNYLEYTKNIMPEGQIPNDLKEILYGQFQPISVL